MKITERLQALRDSFPACRMIAYVDLAAEMVLSTSARTSVPQENLNAMCMTAVETLSGRTVPRLASLFERGKQDGVFEVILIDPDEVGVFLKSALQPTEAFCSVCGPDIPLTEFLRDARAHLHAIEAVP